MVKFKGRQMEFSNMYITARNLENLQMPLWDAQLFYESEAGEYDFKTAKKIERLSKHLDAVIKGFLELDTILND